MYRPELLANFMLSRPALAGGKVNCDGRPKTRGSRIHQGANQQALCGCWLVRLLSCCVEWKRPQRGQRIAESPNLDCSLRAESSRSRQYAGGALRHPIRPSGGCRLPKAAFRHRVNFPNPTSPSAAIASFAAVSGESPCPSAPRRSAAPRKSSTSAIKKVSWISFSGFHNRSADAYVASSSVRGTGCRPSTSTTPSSSAIDADTRTLPERSIKPSLAMSAAMTRP